MQIEMNDELFLQLTEYCNRSDNSVDNRRRAQALGFTEKKVLIAPGAIIRIPNLQNVGDNVFFGLYTYVNGNVTVGNNVLIGAGAKILGPVFIGDNTRVASGSVVLTNLPANSTAAGVPATVVRVNGAKVNPADDLDQQDIPNIWAAKLAEMESRIGRLEVAGQDVPPSIDELDTGSPQ